MNVCKVSVMGPIPYSIKMGRKSPTLSSSYICEGRRSDTLSLTYEVTYDDLILSA